MCLLARDDQYFQKYELCNSHGQNQQKETFMPHKATDRPFEKIGVDLFELKKCNYLVTVDYFSNFREVDPLTSTTTSAKDILLVMVYR